MGRVASVEGSSMLVLTRNQAGCGDLNSLEPSDLNSLEPSDLDSRKATSDSVAIVQMAGDKSADQL